jgi:hypothetical protein
VIKVSVVAVTLDGKKIAVITASSSGSVGAGATGTISISLPLGPLEKILHVLGVREITVSGGTAYIVGFSATSTGVNVTLYNPGTAATTYTVNVTVAVLGV